MKRFDSTYIYILSVHVHTVYYVYRCTMYITYVNVPTYVHSNLYTVSIA